MDYDRCVLFLPNYRQYFVVMKIYCMNLGKTLYKKYIFGLYLNTPKTDNAIAKKIGNNMSTMVFET